ncbi:MAG: hypothetical protein Q4A82_04285 [Corynebacterium sp.]|nr:hypothetical protein [Corynebacterium sp.]
MGVFKSQSKSSSNGSVVVTDYLNSDPEVLMKESGLVARWLVAGLDKAAKLQYKSIIKYVDRLKEKNPQATPADIQAKLNKHFILTVTGTGAGAGMTSAIPAVGFVTGAAAVGVESLAFLDAATFYAIASAYLRGVDISNPERRKAIVLLSVVGSEGTALADATVGTDSAIALLTRASVPRLSELNKRMFNYALKRLSKSVRLAWLGKLMPLGLGAVLGSIANRKIGGNLVDHITETLGPLPKNFPTS